MDMLPTAFILGLAIGAAASIVGAGLSYWFGLRDHARVSRAPLFFLLVIIAVLSFIGAIVSLAAIPSGTVIHALVTGVGVVIGFSITFGLLLGVWLRADEG